jgi:hypothetical protein
MARVQDNYKTLKEALADTYTMDRLKPLAKKIGKKAPPRKAELIEHITSITFNTLKDIISKMKPMAVNALAEAIHNWDGVFRQDQFMAKYGEHPFENTKLRYNEVDILHLFFINGKLPGDLLAQLKTIIPPPEEEGITYSEAWESSKITIRETSHAALMNLNLLLTMVEERKIRVSEKTGKATAATVKKISANLCEGDFYEDDEIGPMQAFAWPLLLQGGGLTTTDGGFLKLTRAGKNALQKDLPGGIKAILKKWEKTKIIDEYSRVTAVKGQRSAKGRTMTAPARRRPAIHDALSCLEPEKWVNFDEMERFMISENHVFEMTNLDWKLYFSDPQYGSLEYYQTWPLLQKRYLLIYFFEYCATLGILDVVYIHPDDARDDFSDCWGADDLDFLSHCDGLMQIRLTELGAYALGILDEYGSTDGQNFELQDTSIVHTGSDIPTPNHTLFLNKIAEQQASNRWEVSFSSLINAVKSEETTLKEIRKFITELTSKKPGNALKQLFKEVEERSSAVVQAGEVTLLTCRLEARKQILTDQQLGKLCMPAGDRHLVILPGKKELFAKRLEALGFILGI